MPDPVVNPPATGSGVSSTILVEADSYNYRGAWDPNTIYQGNLGAHDVPKPADIVEYDGAFWLANYYSTDQSPPLSGQYGAWLQITDTLTGTINNQSGSSIGIPVKNNAAPAANANPAVPFPVTNLSSVHISPTSEQLFWTASAVYGVGDVSSYTVYEQVTSIAGITSSVLLGTTTSTTFNATGLTAGASYTFKVVASDAVGNSGNVNTNTNKSDNPNTDGYQVTNAANSVSENPPAPGASSTQMEQAQGKDYLGHPITLQFSTVANPTLSTTTLTAQGQSGKYVSPYIDTTVPGNDLLKLAAQSGTATSAGLHNFTLAFIQTDKADFTLNSGGDSQTGPFTLKTVSGAPVVPTLSFGGLGGVTPESTGTIIQQVKAVEAGGGTITISIGGYTGLDPAVANAQYYADLKTPAGGGFSDARAMKMAVTNLQTELQSILSTYGVHHLDFDVEGMNTVNNTTANSIRDQALVALEKANPGLSVSFTLATTASGLSGGNTPSGGIGATEGMTQNVLGVLQKAATDGVKIDVVNIMAMDYYDGNTAESGLTGQNAMYTNAVSAAKATEGQIQTIAGNLAAQGVAWSAPLLGITPMIGQNDDVGTGGTGSVDEIFTLTDATMLTAWASQQAYVAGIGEWELPRDTASNTTNTTAAQQDSSGVVQSQDQFTNTFLAINNATTLVFNSSTAQSYNQVISGDDGVSFQGTGSLALTAADTYTGATAVGATTLLLKGAGSIAASSGVSLQNATSVLDISGASGPESLQNLSGVAGSKVNLGANLLVLNGTGATTFDGVFADGGASGGAAGSLTIGAGESLTLTAAQAFTGKLQVLGSLYLSGDSAGVGSSKNLGLKGASAVFDMSGVNRQETILNLNGVAGSKIYLGHEALRINQTTAATYAGVIADGGSHGGTGGSFVVKGTANLDLTGQNTFTGGITLQSGSLELGSSGAAGAKASTITFAGNATLVVDNVAMTPANQNSNDLTLLNPIKGFAVGDVIDLKNLAYQGASTIDYSGGRITVTEGSFHDYVNFTGLNNPAFQASSDGHGGTSIQLLHG